LKNDKNISKIYEDLESINNTLSRKTDIFTSNKMKDELKRCALYVDYKELYNKTMIPMKKFTDEIIKFREEHT